MKRTFGFLITYFLGVVLCTCHAQDEVRDYSWFLKQLIDLDRLPFLEDGTTCKQFSSYDRASHDPSRWGANGDCGKYLKVTEEGALMAEMEGPGCIYRIWSANPQGIIRFYLDGDTKPTYEYNFPDIFHDKIPPFKPPIAMQQEGWEQGQTNRAANCFLPIPYEKSCRVMADKPHSQYYHINYVTYPRGTKLKTFRLPLTSEEQALLDKVCEIWNKCGTDPKPPRPNAQTEKKELVLVPGQKEIVLSLQGPATIQSIKARLTCDARYALRKVMLRIYWDDAPKPSVQCPLGDFFGTAFGENMYQSMPLGMTEDGYYCYWPMPFKKSACIEVTNEAHKPATLKCEIIWAKVDNFPPNTAYFHAKWRREAPCLNFDYPIIITRGKGRFVGTALFIDSPNPGWWGEGDEKVWVDGESFPSTFGTGSEDYFSDAWGMHKGFIRPWHGCSMLEGTRTCCYRWHIADAIPFYSSYRMTIENYALEKDYSSVAYWYQLPPDDDFFKDYTVEERRPWGKTTSFSHEMESLLADALKSEAKILDDTDLPYEFSHGKAVDLGDIKAGHRITFTGPFVDKDGVYNLVFHAAPETPLAAYEVYVNSVKVGSTPPDYPKSGLARVGRAFIARGTPELAFHFTSDGKAILDCLQILPPTNKGERQERFIEGERLKILATSGPDTQVEWCALDWSNGAQLLFPAQKAEDWFTVELPQHHRGKFILTGQLTQGPDYGDVQVFQNDAPVGDVIPGYSQHLRLNPKLYLGKIELTDKDHIVQFKIVGKDEKSSGYKLGLDYVRLDQPLVEGAIEAEIAKVVESKGATPTTQLMGGYRGQWSGGAHLFFTPKEKGSYVTIQTPALEKDGEYTLDIYYTFSWDYAIIALAVDGQPVGEPKDTFAPQVMPPTKVTYGPLTLKAGPHTLTFTALDKNPASKGYYMGIDCVKFSLMER